MNVKQMFEVGQTASLTKTFSQEEVSSFSVLSMDDNPIHFDKKYASTTPFNKCIVQGPLVASLIGGVLGSKLPGPGTIYVQQISKFLRPVFVDETILIQVKIISIREDKPIIVLRTTVEKENGDLIIEGEAVIKFIHDGGYKTI